MGKSVLRSHHPCPITRYSLPITVFRRIRPGSTAMPLLDLPDCKLHYQVDDHTDPWTKPDTVLFVHGFTENIEAWRAWVPHFSRRYRMVRVDQRGFGKSGAVPKDYPLTTERYV